MSSGTDRDALERRIEKRKQRLAQALHEKGRLKWFLVLSVTTWPLGLFAGPWYAAWIGCGWLVFWAVGSYSNYFHIKQAKTNLQNAEDELSALLMKPGA
ncbi:MAG: hypothetical protein ACO3JL_03135 [Myxococcota bacterium]